MKFPASFEDDDDFKSETNYCIFSENNDDFNFYKSYGVEETGANIDISYFIDFLGKKPYNVETKRFLVKETLWQFVNLNEFYDYKRRTRQL